MIFRPRRKTGKTKPSSRKAASAKAAKSRRVTALAGAAVLMLVVGLWLAKGLLSPPPPKATYRQATKPPPFEEPRATLIDRDLGAIDEALLTALRKVGIGSKQIQISLSVDPREEITLFKVRLDKSLDLKALAEAIKKRIAATKGKVTWKITPTGLELTVRLNGRKTHHLSLLTPASLPVAPPSPPSAPKSEKPRVALVMDDMGYHLEPVKRLLALRMPVTFSLLPHSTHTGEIVSLAAENGREIMLHLPMEPKSYPRMKPGPGALLTSMPAAKLAQITREDLASVPGAVGANNHMGSRFTEDVKALEPVLGELKKRGLFFVDSLTSPHSQAFALARKMGIPCGRRDIFLDHDHSAKAVRSNLERLLRLNTCCNGYIVIGHPHDTTLDALEAYSERLKKKLHLVPVSDLLIKAGAAQSPHKARPRLQRTLRGNLLTRLNR